MSGQRKSSPEALKSGQRCGSPRCTCLPGDGVWTAARGHPAWCARAAHRSLWEPEEGGRRGRGDDDGFGEEDGEGGPSGSLALHDEGSSLPSPLKETLNKVLFNSTGPVKCIGAVDCTGMALTGACVVAKLVLYLCDV